MKTILKISLLANSIALFFAWAYVTALPIDFWFRAPAQWACCLLAAVVSAELWVVTLKKE